MDEKVNITKCPKCGYWMEGDKCGVCINMPDEQLRKYAGMIADHYQSWGSPTYFTYDILKRLVLSLLSSEEKRIEELEEGLKGIKVWLHFLCRDIGTNRQEETMLALTPHIQNLEKLLEK